MRGGGVQETKGGGVRRERSGRGNERRRSERRRNITGARRGSMREKVEMREGGKQFF